MVVFHEDTIGGATRSVLRALPLLRDRGWQFVFYVADPSPLSDELRRDGWDVRGRERHVGFSLQWLRHPPGPARKLRSMPGWFAGFGRLLREERPALVHANSLYSLAEGAVASALGVPALLHVHEMLNANWKGPAARRTAAFARLHVVAVSEASAQRYAGKGSAVPVVYESSPVPAEAPPLPERDTVTVGTIGNVCHRKGTDVFVEAARLVRAETDRVRFHLVGPVLDNPERQWAEDVVRAAQATGVTYQERADAFASLAEWDIFALTSRFDPFPLVVLEAMACARPVVGTAVDGVSEQLGDAGVLIAPEDPRALADAVLALAADRERRAALGDAARERMSTRFTPAEQADALEHQYRRIALTGA